MSKNLDTQPTTSIDDARRVFCDKLAGAIQAGALRFQIRFIRRDEAIENVWIYVFQKDTWHKRDDLAFPMELAASLRDQMDMVSTREYADAWNCRRIDHPDRTDFELTFRQPALEHAITGDLKSFLNGCLFHGHHDSGKNQRRRIRFEGR